MLTIIGSKFSLAANPVSNAAYAPSFAYSLGSNFVTFTTQSLLPGAQDWMIDFSIVPTSSSIPLTSLGYTITGTYSSQLYVETGPTIDMHYSQSLSNHEYSKLSYTYFVPGPNDANHVLRTQKLTASSTTLHNASLVIPSFQSINVPFKSKFNQAQLSLPLSFTGGAALNVTFSVTAFDPLGIDITNTTAPSLSDLKAADWLSQTGSASASFSLSVAPGATSVVLPDMSSLLQALAGAETWNTTSSLVFVITTLFNENQANNAFVLGDAGSFLLSLNYTAPADFDSSYTSTGDVLSLGSTPAVHNNGFGMSSSNIWTSDALFQATSGETVTGTLVLDVPYGTTSIQATFALQSNQSYYQNAQIGIVDASGSTHTVSSQTGLSLDIIVVRSSYPSGALGASDYLSLTVSFVITLLAPQSANIGVHVSGSYLAATGPVGFSNSFTVHVVQALVGSPTYSDIVTPPVDAGDTLQFSVSIAPKAGSSAPIFGVTVNQTFQYLSVTSFSCTPQCSLVPGTASHLAIAGNGSIATQGGPRVFVVEAASYTSFYLDVLLPTETLQINWVAQVTQSLLFGPYLNLSTSVAYTTNTDVLTPGFVYRGPAFNDTILIQQPSAGVTVVSSSVPETPLSPTLELTPDELVTLMYTVKVPKGTSTLQFYVIPPTNALRVVSLTLDAIGSGFSVQSLDASVGTAAKLSANELANTAASILVGSKLVNVIGGTDVLDGTDTLNFTAVLHFVPFLAIAYSLRNTVVSVQGIVDDGIYQSSVWQPVLLVEPQLVVSDLSVYSAFQAGDVIEQSALISYASFPSTAYKGVFQYTFYDKQTFDTTSLQACYYLASSGIISGAVTELQCALVDGTLVDPVNVTSTSFTFDFALVDAGYVLHMTFSSTLQQAAYAGEHLASPFALSYFSTGLSAPYAGKGYESDGIFLCYAALPAIDIAMIASSDPNVPVPHLTIDEEATFLVTVAMPGSTTATSVVITLPPDTLYLSAFILGIGPSISTDGQAHSLAVGSSNGRSTVSVNFGLLTILTNRSHTSADSIQFNVTLRIIDDASNNGLNSGRSVPLNVDVLFDNSQDQPGIPPFHISFLNLNVFLCRCIRCAGC